MLLIVIQIRLQVEDFLTNKSQHTFKIKKKIIKRKN